MPNVFKNRIKGYRFFFYSNEGSEPVHVHVSKAGNVAKFWLHPVALAKNNGFTQMELTFIKKLVETRVNSISNKWNEHFSK